MAQQYPQVPDPSMNIANGHQQGQPQSNAAGTHPFTRKTGAIRSRDWETDSSKPGSSRLRREIPFMSSSVASSAINRFLAIRVREEGFERAETAALVRLEMEVTAFIEQIFSRAKAFSDNSARGRPTAADAIAAVQEYDLDIAELKQEVKESKKRARKRKRAGEPDQSLNLELVPPERRSSSPELLASDDENTPPVVPQTLRSLPPHLPPLPPKHTYLQTPVPPPKKQALPSLEKKLENAALVQESLRNLLLATEVNADANDKELFGGVVNWEATKYPRKKWKIGGS